jgi:hypothetical protein
MSFLNGMRSSFNFHSVERAARAVRGATSKWKIAIQAGGGFGWRTRALDPIVVLATNERFNRALPGSIQHKT